MRKIKYKQHYAETPNGWTEWVRPIRKGYKMACCDCNLVHDLDFRIRKEWRGNVVEFRARRNDTASKQLRKAFKNETD